MDLEFIVNLIEVCVKTSAVLTVGDSFAHYLMAINYLRRDPFMHEEYEKQWEQKKRSSLIGFFDYYAGYAGRKIAYSEIDNPLNW